MGRVISEDDLIELGENARAAVSESAGNCRTVSKRFAQLLDDRGVSASVREYQMGEARETHFCLSVPCSAVEEYEDLDGNLLVDATLDQFSLEAWRAGETDVGLEPADWLTGVNIYPPDAEERLVWYHSPNTPDDVPV